MVTSVLGKTVQPSYSCHSFPVSTCTIVPNFTGSVTDLCYNKKYYYEESVIYEP